MKKLRISAVILAVALVVGSSFTKTQKGCTPAFYSTDGGQTFIPVGPHTCPTSSEVCTYYDDDPLAICEDDGTYTPSGK